MKIPHGKLKYGGQSSDGKRAYVNHEDADFRIDVDTDDTDEKLAIAMTKELIRRWNSFEK